MTYMTDINRLISLGIEIEGLLRVMESRGSSEARQLLALKFDNYSALMRACLDSAGDDAAEAAAPVVPAPEACETAQEPAVQAPVAEEAVVAEEPEAVEVAEVAEEPSAEPASVKLQEAEEPEVVDEIDATAAVVAKNDTPRQPARQCPLIKAFTLNDKFRFRRELFAGDDEDFASTLALLEQMPSFEEAADYLYHDLLWDRRNEAVVEFMEILKANMPA